jgi:hypothetical protein
LAVILGLLALTSCSNVPPNGVALDSGRVVITFKLCASDSISTVQLSDDSGSHPVTIWIARLVDPSKPRFEFPIDQTIPGYDVTDRIGGRLKAGVRYGTDAQTVDGRELVGTGFHVSDLRDGEVLSHRRGQATYVALTAWRRQPGQCAKDRPYLLLVYPLILLLVAGVIVARRLRGRGRLDGG